MSPLVRRRSWHPQLLFLCFQQSSLLYNQTLFFVFLYFKLSKYFFRCLPLILLPSIYPVSAQFLGHSFLFKWPQICYSQHPSVELYFPYSVTMLLIGFIVLISDESVNIFLSISMIFPPFQ